jgi:translation initiation factor eIF-2B subunit epsilon
VEVGVDDAGSDTSGSESSTASESESEESESESASASGSPTSFTLSRSGSDIPSLSLDTSISDFRAECVQSLERAFTEGHTVENAAIELKTLRMATNVPLKLVKEVVASFMIQRIKWDPQNPTGNTRAVDVIVARWGGLIQGLGGDDPVETLLIFQVCISLSQFRILLTCSFHIVERLRVSRRWLTTIRGNPQIIIQQ